VSQPQVEDDRTEEEGKPKPKGKKLCRREVAAILLEQELPNDLHGFQTAIPVPGRKKSDLKDFVNR